MTQPFREGTSDLYRPASWPEIRFEYEPFGITARGGASFRCASSAFYNGGIRDAAAILNRRVPLTYLCDDPVQEMRTYLEGTNLSSERTIGLLTAAKLTHASIMDTSGDWYRLTVCTTAGTRNAAKAGTARDTYPSYRPGTINTIVLVDARMTDGAMLNALMTATEAKSAALWDADIRDQYDASLRATGTTTDACVIATTQRADHPVAHAYAGCASDIGNAIGRLVYASVTEAVRTQHEE
jgi:adenosylcobinamide hydrolase